MVDELPRVTDPVAASMEFRERYGDRTFGEKFKAARRVEWIGNWLADKVAYGDAGDIDPEFQLTSEANTPLFEQLTKDIPEDWWPKFSSALSEKHAWQIRNNILERVNANRVLQAGGASGAGARMLASIVDPVEVGMTMATMGTINPALTNSSRIVRALANLGVDLAVETTAESLRIDADPTRTMDEIVPVMLGVLAFDVAGEVGTGLIQLRKAAGDAQRRAIVYQMAKTLDAAGISPEDLPRGPGAQRVKDLFLIADYKPEKLPPHVKTQADMLLHLAEQAGYGTPEMLRLGDLTPAFASKMRSSKNRVVQKLSKVFDFPISYGMQSKLGRSKSRNVRQFGNAALRNPFGVKGGGESIYSVSEWMAHMSAQNHWTIMSSLDEAIQDYLKRNPTSRWKRGQIRRNIEEATTYAISGADTDYIPAHLADFVSDPAVVKHANTLRPYHNEWLGMLRRWEIPGFESIPNDPNYISRMWNADRVREGIQRFGSAEALDGFIARSIQAKVEGLSNKHARALATAIRRNTVRRDVFNLDMALDVFDAENRERLSELLMTELDNVSGSGEVVTKADVDEIITRIEQIEGLEGDKSPRAKRRIPLDENYSEVIDEATGDAFHIRELMETNSTFLALSYGRHASGLLGENAILRNFSITDAAGNTRMPSWSELLDMVRAEADNAITKKEADAIASDLRTMSAVRDMIRGYSPQSGMGPTVDKFIQRIKLFNTARIAPRFGLASVPEMIGVLGRSAVQSAKTGMPDFNRTVRSMLKGTFSKESAEEMYAAGVALEKYFSQGTSRYGSLGLETVGNAGKADQVLRKMAEVGSNIGGLRNLTNGGEAAVATMILHKFYGAAKGKVKLSTKRLRSMGFHSIGEFNEAVSELAQHAIIDEAGFFTGIDFKVPWKDEMLKAKVLAAVNREAHLTILRPDIGDLSKWMTHPLASLLIQFKTFHFSSWKNLLLRKLYFHDTAEIAGMGGTLVGAMFTYTALQYLNLAGKPNAKAELQKRLAWDEIARGAVQRAGWSSLIPGAVDTAMWMGGRQAVFRSYGTTWGRNTDFVTGSPSYDLMKKLYGASRAAAGVPAGAVGLSKYKFSQEDYNNLMGLAPWVSLYGVKNFFDLPKRALPKHSLDPKDLQ